MFEFDSKFENAMHSAIEDGNGLQSEDVEMSSTLPSPKIIFSTWQKSQLQDLPLKGVECLVHSWFATPVKDVSYCNATWDSFYCWPATPPGEIVNRSCSEIMKDDDEDFHFEGNAFRICSENGTWLWGNWTNYTECLDDYEKVQQGDLVVIAVRYILFIGSIVSFLCLGVSLFIFYYFKCLRCDRITVHVHLMVALALRFILLIVITEPFIFQRDRHYRDVDWICKGVLSLQLYASIASINWMFIQGHYLHSRLTTNVFDRGTPFKIYHGIGWILPLILIVSWTLIMEKYHPVHCWKNYGEEPFIWIIVGPMVVALLANLGFLINIMRILLTKIQLSTSSTDSAQFRRAVKATVILFPLLGINNLLFFYNPGGDYENAYMIVNTICQSTQGILVSVLYCYISSDVRDAIRREYGRFSARRSANSIRRTQSRRRAGSYSTTRAENPQQLKPTTHFRSRLRSSTRRQGDEDDESPSPETMNFLNDTPSPPSPATLNVNNGRHAHFNLATNNGSHGEKRPKTYALKTETIVIQMNDLG